MARDRKLSAYLLALFAGKAQGVPRPHLPVQIPSVKSEIERIASMTDEEFAREHGITEPDSPSQLRAIQIVLRMLNRQALLDFAIECAVQAIDVVKEQYATEQAILTASAVLSSHPACLYSDYKSAFDEVERFLKQARCENDLQHDAEFAKQQYIAYEDGIRLDIVVSAIAIIKLCFVVCMKPNDEELIDTMDVLMFLIGDTKPLKEKREQAQTTFSRLMQAI